MGTDRPWKWRLTTENNQDDAGQTTNDQLQDDCQSWLCWFYMLPPPSDYKSSCPPLVSDVCVVGWEDACPKSSFSPPCQAPWQSGDKNSYRRREGAPCRKSALTVILKWFICGLSSVILVVLSTVTLQSHGQFVPSSLRPILGIVAAYVMATV